MVRYMVVPGGVADGATAEAEAEAKAEVVAEAKAEVDAVSCRRSLLLRLLFVFGRGLQTLLYGRPLNERSPVDGVLLLKLSYRNWGNPFYVACAASEQTPPR
jgi:hypothetical protein